MSRLKKPKNYRRTMPRCCVTCKHYEFDGTLESWCERAPDTIRWDDDIDNTEPYYCVCDRYQWESTNL